MLKSLGFVWIPGVMAGMLVSGASPVYAGTRLNDLPIKEVNGATVYVRDVAHVRDGYAVQTNIVSQNRIRSALLTVLKSASASTLDIIKRVKEALPRIQATLPKTLAKICGD
jgi:multidrug efflux pump subunit AcrB